MYDSNISAADLVSSVSEEVDISLTIPSSAWVRIINETEQKLYTDIIKEIRTVSLVSPVSPMFLPDTIPPDAGENQCIFEDIAKVYADGGKTELLKAGAIAEYATRKNIYWKDGGKLAFRLVGDVSSDSMRVLYYVRPALKTVSDGVISSDHIALPVEFVEMMASRLRAEAYKIANEDSLAAKWMNDYNSYLEEFKEWTAMHNDIYGER